MRAVLACEWVHAACTDGIWAVSYSLLSPVRQQQYFNYYILHKTQNYLRTESNINLSTTPLLVVVVTVVLLNI